MLEKTVHIWTGRTILKHSVYKDICWLLWIVLPNFILFRPVIVNNKLHLMWQYIVCMTGCEVPYTRYVVIGAHSICQQSVSDLPGENGWTLSFVLSNFTHNLWCGHPGFTPSNGPRTYGACLIVPAQNLTHTAVRHLDKHRTWQIGQSYCFCQ